MLGGQTFNATGAQIDQGRPVFKLNINYTAFDKLLRFVFRQLSRWLCRTWIQPVLLHFGPRLLLPDTVILKQRVKNDDGTILAFKTEEETYTEYKHLQGSLMPYYYGKAYCGTVPALILSQATGKALRELSPEERDEALPVVKMGYESLSDVGLVHGDPRLDHIFFYDGKHVMFIDFNLAFREKHEGVARRTNRVDYLDIQELL